MKSFKVAILFFYYFVGVLQHVEAQDFCSEVRFTYYVKISSNVTLTFFKEKIKNSLLNV